MKRFSIALALLALALATGAHGEPVIRMSTTTSTEHSGLLGAILPAFEAKAGQRVHVIAVGSGKALELAKNGDVDLTLVHARDAEDAFVAAGHGIDRRDVMHNDFVVVCAANDPARIRGLRDVVAGFRTIADSKVRFVSRGDNSGTDMMEQSYWRAAAGKPPAPRYVSAGLGMGEVLSMTAEMQACTLSDRATFVSYRARTGLAVMVEGDARMRNPYGVIRVNPARHPGTNSAGALMLADWLTSAEGQARIAAFRREGQQLFFPALRAR